MEIDKAIEILEKEPPLIRIEGDSVLIVGDLHGTLEGLEYAKKALYGGTVDKVVFLGDYVDRGPYQLEAINGSLELKIESPDKVFLLRGNHEFKDINLAYGFYWHVERRAPGSYQKYLKVFSQLPIAALLNSETFLVHGGISSYIKRMEDILKVKKAESYPDSIMELFWNDPSDFVDYFALNYMRGGYCVYGEKAVDEFFRENGLKRMIRSHEYFWGGFMEHWGGKVITVHSSSSYGPCSVLVIRGDEYKVVPLV